jgi:hypothetical protein
MQSLQETAMGGGPATAKTASYVLVAADAGTTVAMNAAGATTITVNTGLFAAGDTVFIQNLGAGACTVTAGTATVATAGSLILPQNDAGILYFTSASAAIFYDYIQAGAVSPLTTKGDLYTFSTSDARLAVGANGTTLVADSSEATGLKWAAASGGGKVLQVVSTTYTTATSVTGSTFAATGLSLSITPTLATSKVLILVQQTLYNTRAAADSTGCGLRLKRGSTVIDTPMSSGSPFYSMFWYGSGSTGQRVISGVVPLTYLDSPATTSSTTYTTEMANEDANGTTTAQISSSMSTITLLEIGA